MKLNIMEKIRSSVFALTYKSLHMKLGAPTSQVVEIAIFLMVCAFILPIAITQFTGVNTTGWDANIILVWDNLPILCVVALLIGVLGYISIKKRI